MYIKEEQASSDESRPRQNPKERRHRASVACTSCRGRRIRCVVPSGKKTCIQCERSSTTCIIKDDDERRRPISRAYVYSLVERVALLERTLEEHGVKIPPANHPPEMRHRSCQIEDISAESASSFSSTPQESLSSDYQPTTSPSSPDGQIEDDCRDKDKKKRSSDMSIPSDSSINSMSSKRVRHDSLISSAIVKSEMPIDPILDDEAAQYKEAFVLDQSLPMPPPPQTTFWPMTYDHNGGLTSLLPTISDASMEQRTYSAWSNDPFGFHGYNSHDLVSEYDGRLPNTYGIEDSCTPRRFPTNLDFMPLSLN